MDKNYMESVLWAFKELFNKGLIYESMRVMPYSWACETPLSNFETKLDNSYRQRTDKAITVSFILTDRPQNAPEGFTEYRILAWTTTPWTIPGNRCIAYGEALRYVVLEITAVAEGSLATPGTKIAVAEALKDAILSECRVTGHTVIEIGRAHV